VSARFGPAGNDASFPSKSSIDAPSWLSSMGLYAYEYQCGRGVRVSEGTAEAIGEAAKKHGISLSVHAPYFISLSGTERDRVEKSIGYILQSGGLARTLGASRVVVHCGGLCGLTRDEALRNTMENLKEALLRMRDMGISGVSLCIETMGKKNVLGTTEEVARICEADEALLPCVDFGHVNARTNGGIQSFEDASRELSLLEGILGFERVKKLHVHFSRIEFSAGGEVRHLTYDDERFGPSFDPVAAAMIGRGYEPVVICESAGTQARDAVLFQGIWNALLEAREKEPFPVCHPERREGS